MAHRLSWQEFLGDMDLAKVAVPRQSRCHVSQDLTGSFVNQTQMTT